MSFASKYNKGKKFNINTDGFEYISIKDAFGKYGINPIKIFAIYINTKGKFGDAPVVATESEFINLPSHMTETCKMILEDADDVESINAGKVGITLYEYLDEKHNKQCYGANWCDM